jgi:tetratricopeptide (TPR) repeat protein
MNKKATDKKMRLFCIIALLFQGGFLGAQATDAQDALPGSFYMFRDAVYMQNADADEIVRLYTAARAEIEQTLVGTWLYTALSRCAYLAGLAFQSEGRKSEAAAYYDQGIIWAENSIALNPTSEAYQYLAENIALACSVKPLSYILANHDRIDETAQKALALDPQNLMAQYVIAAKYIRAPWPVGNVKRGAVILREILNQDLDSLEREDLCNVYLAMAIVCQKERNSSEEEIWQTMALSLYPGNRFRETLFKQSKK